MGAGGNLEGDQDLWQQEKRDKVSTVLSQDDRKETCL